MDCALLASYQVPASSMSAPEINPYESPRGLAPTDVPEFYTSDNRRLRIRECWRALRNPLTSALVVTFKIFGIRVQSVVAFGPSMALIAPADFPAGANERVRPLVDEALAGGFRWQFCY